jgi:hypothetical protein
MVKFKIGFTITPEVLFGIIGKVLPLEDLHIEQLVEAPMPDPAIRFDRRFDLPSPKPKKKQRRYTRKNPSIPMDLSKGINDVIMTALKLRPHRAVELRPLLKERGYSRNSAGSRLQNLEKHGIIESMQNGYWRLSVDELKKHLKESA